MATKTTTTKKTTTAPSSTTVGGKTYSKGDSFTDSAGRTGTVSFDTKTGARLSDPVSSSTAIRAGNNALGSDISGLTKAYKAEQAQIQQQMAALAERRVNEVSGIKTEFDIAKLAQEAGQAKDYAGRSTSLITSGGGFLGATQSQEGVLQNLKGTFEAEKTALMAKREAAILAANTAYEDKDFALAREYAKSARDYQNEIYSRQKDLADQDLALAREGREQSKFELDKAEKQAEVYSLMSDEDFANLDPNEIAKNDAIHFPGYTAKLREVNKKIAEGKSLKEDIATRSAIQTLINKTPQGKKIVLSDGSVYVGMKKPIGLAGASGISPALANQLGVPSLAGKKESDVILSLAFDSAPQWYKDYHKSAGLPSNDVATDWQVFKQQPDISSYAKSAVVTSRIAGTNNIWGGITPESIANALSDIQDE